jgi:hypothetical protein
LSLSSMMSGNGPSATKSPPDGPPKISTILRI